ncbi:hypothetical protein KFE25_010214 [Diacronema lutheri]|uniref:Micro-fibrillar-associated protein 1 C-terminal domain-containing protein n=2 Tax=Diacronema lutheri TaxID=2081491 RepID=A0A8J5XAC4_DIALT|nr:hypothetical protein KFE25_010214 [Diacronema lutheri]
MSGARLGPQRGPHAALTGTGRSEVREQGVEVVPVKRYWPGKAPAWASGHRADDASDPRAAPAGAAQPPDGGLGAAERPRERHEGAIVARASAHTLPPPGNGAARVDEEEEDDDDDIDARRERARARARALVAEEEETAGARAQPRPSGGPDHAEGSDSEYETDTGSDDESDGAAPAGRVLLKPLFVPKGSRQTVNAQQAAEEAEEEAERRRIEKLAERRKETLELVVESARRELEGADEGAAADMPDDADDEDDVGEYEAWKVREIRRVMAERERVAAAERERAEIERRRGLTDDERLREDAALLSARASDDDGKGRRTFLQKYFHKGAFFQQEDADGNPMLGDIMKRDFGEATGADVVDKASLPKPMQVKKFGFRSQVKWTHLSAEDTTNREDILHARDQGRGRGGAWPAGRGGVGRGSRPDSFERPSGKRPRV